MEDSWMDKLLGTAKDIYVAKETAQITADSNMETQLRLDQQSMLSNQAVATNLQDSAPAAPGFFDKIMAGEPAALAKAGAAAAVIVGLVLIARR